MNAVFISLLLLLGSPSWIVAQKEQGDQGVLLNGSGEGRGLKPKNTKAPGGSTKAPVVSATTRTKTPTVTKTTKSATSVPSESPSLSVSPSESPSSEPSQSPSETPSAEPSLSPSESPSSEPSLSPSESPSSEPSQSPSESPSAEPSLSPSERPSSEPSLSPSESPSSEPSLSPSESPSSEPSLSPSESPSAEPSLSPSESPSSEPSLSPSESPSFMPSVCEPKAMSDQDIIDILSTIADDTGSLIDTADTPQKSGFEYVRDYPFDLDSCSSDAEWHQRFALAVILYSIPEAEARLRDRWVTTSPATDECDWAAVTCDTATETNALTLSFTGAQFEGSIPWEIAGLSALTSLYLTANPDLVSNNLEALAGLSTNLELLSLAKNGMTSLPTELGLLTNLVTLYLNENDPSLVVPSEICDLLYHADLNPTGKLTNLQCGDRPYLSNFACCPSSSS